MALMVDRYRAIGVWRFEPSDDSDRIDLRVPRNRRLVSRNKPNSSDGERCPDRWVILPNGGFRAGMPEKDLMIRVAQERCRQRGAWSKAVIQPTQEYQTFRAGLVNAVR